LTVTGKGSRVRPAYFGARTDGLAVEIEIIDVTECDL
jgi:hypothetical protein